MLDINPETATLEELKAITPEELAEIAKNAPEKGVGLVKRRLQLEPIEDAISRLASIMGGVRETLEGVGNLLYLAALGVPEGAVGSLKATGAHKDVSLIIKETRVFMKIVQKRLSDIGESDD